MSGVRKRMRSKPARIASVFALLLFSLLCAAPSARAQQIVDMTVATINSTELITYSDLLWQLALEPDRPLDQIRSDDLQQALERVINQRLIAQEAANLPTIAPTAAEVDAELNYLVNRFRSRAEFEQRARRVGLTGDRIRELVRQRVEIEKYVDFRFRAFTVVTQAEVEAYYREVYVPRLRRVSPGRLIPSLQEVFNELQQELTLARIESDIDRFLEEARARAEIVILNPV